MEKIEIEKYWQKIQQNKTLEEKEKEKILNTINEIDKGNYRVVLKENGKWIVNDFVKKTILMYFSIQKNQILTKEERTYYDKIPLKFTNWTTDDFNYKQIRVVPGAVVRYPSYIEEKTVIMPSFINVGAHVGSGTMIDTWATVGSCAYVGKNCHISGGTGIGGVLEPIGEMPTIIEDNCFIGARSEIAEGVIVGEGSVISMGVYITQSTKIFNRETGEITYGNIPPYSVVIPGSIPDKNNNNVSIYCAVIAKKVDQNTMKKISLNETLRVL